MRGNVVARIASRDNNFRPNQLVLQHPDEVSVHRNSDGYAEWHFSGTSVDTENVWHRRSFPIPGCIWGLSPIGMHALTIGLGISAEQFGAQFFLDGGHPTALFQNTQKTIDPEAAATIKQRIRAVLSGNREPLVLGADWDYKPLQVTPGDSQFLETNNYTASECARIFGPGMPAVLGYETGGSLTYANVEQFNQQLLTFTLDPWLVRLERMLYDLLPRPQYAKFNRGALLRTDLLTRYRAHEIALRNEFEVVNEVRDMEDRSPSPGVTRPPRARPPRQFPSRWSRDDRNRNRARCERPRGADGPGDAPVHRQPGRGPQGLRGCRDRPDGLRLGHRLAVHDARLPRRVRGGHPLRCVHQDARREGRRAAAAQPRGAAAGSDQVGHPEALRGDGRQG
jgi:HK97 family phage portal protein